ncbi:MAG: CD1871A family CXXC motif-containing protein [Pseudoflavonifractor sp.]
MIGFLKEHRAALGLLLLGFAFLAIGVWRGEAETVFRKAVNICMECIGLG